MTVEFTFHNIRLDDGSYTKPDMGHSMESYPFFASARRLLDALFPGDKSAFRLADLGCLEGGYAVEFARLGFQVLGLEVRGANIAACEYVASKTNLPNLKFVKDNAWNIEHHGVFDVVFCCGLLYHLDRPKAFLEMLSRVTRKAVILQTHFSTSRPYFHARARLPGFIRRMMDADTGSYWLSALCENERLEGRWYMEYESDTKMLGKRDAAKWSSWDNRRSFWVRREHLLQAIQDVGFDVVLEQFDGCGPDIADTLLRGYYRQKNRGTFVGIKT